MADTTHNVRSVWYAQDRNVLAFLGQLNSGLSNSARASGQFSQSAMQSNNYLKALSVTMRYAFAGEVIQRIRLAYQNLREFQTGLAGVVAVGTEANNTTQLTAKSMQYLGQAALQTSNDTTVAAQDILETYRSIYSSIQGVSPKQVASLGSLATIGAGISETDPRTFIQAIIGMRNAFGREAGTMADIADQFFSVIQRSINMSGDEWAHYSGRLVASSRQAGVSLSQMNALMVLMTRSGGTAAVNIRHLSQLLSRIKFPTKSAQPFYESAGIPLVGGAVVNSSTGVDILRQLLTHAAKVGGVAAPDFSAKGVNTLTPQEWQQQFQAATTGSGLAFLHSAVGGRMEAFRAFLVISQHLRQFQTELDAAGKSQGAVKKAYDRFIKEKPLEVMANSMNVFTTGTLQHAGPLFRALAHLEHGFTGAALRAENWLGVHGTSAVTATNASISHILSRGLHIGGINVQPRTLAKNHVGIEVALASLLVGGVAAAKYGKIPGLRNFGRLGRGSTDALLTAEALPAALAGTQGNGSRAQPLWTIIHPLSWYMVPPGTFAGGGGGGGIKSPWNAIKKFFSSPTGDIALAASVASKAKSLAAGAKNVFLRSGRAGGSLTGAFAAQAPAIPDMIDILLGKDPFKRKNPAGAGPSGMRKQGFGPMVSRYFTLDQSNNLVPRKGTPQWVTDVLHQKGPNKINQVESALAGLAGSRFSGTSQNLNQLSKGHSELLRQVLRSPGVSVVGQNQIKGEVVATIQLDPGPKLKGLVNPKQVRVHIPTKLWKDAQPAPTSRGKAKEVRHN